MGRTPRAEPLLRRGLQQLQVDLDLDHVAEGHRTKQFEHPDVGALHFAFEVLLLADDDQQLVTWRADDAVSEGRLATLVREGQRVSPAQLSVVVNR